MPKKLLFILFLLSSSFAHAESFFELRRAIIILPSGVKFDTAVDNNMTVFGTMTINRGRIEQDFRVCEGPFSCEDLSNAANVTGVDENITTVQVIHDNGVASEFTVVSFSPLTTLVANPEVTEVDIWELSSRDGRSSTSAFKDFKPTDATLSEYIREILQ